MKKNPTAAEMGRAGGKASAQSLSADQRKARAARASKARWSGKKTSARSVGVKGGGE